MILLQFISIGMEKKMNFMHFLQFALKYVKIRREYRKKV